MNSFLSVNQVITNSQYGCMKNVSTDHAVFDANIQANYLWIPLLT